MRLFQKKEGAPAKGLPRRILPLALAAAVLAAGASAPCACWAASEAGSRSSRIL